MHSTKLKQFKRHLLAGAVLAAFAGGAAADIVDLGTLEGGTRSYAYGVSADGTVVVGNGDQCSGAGCTRVNRGFRWTSSGGMSSLEGQSDTTGTYATGVSADGRVVVGTIFASNPYSQAVRWTSTGMAFLGYLNGGTWSEAYATSANGDAIVGRADNGNAGGMTHAFRWTAATGMVSLGTLPGGETSRAFAVNSDGTVVVGDSAIDNFVHRHAFRWTEASNSMEDLGTLSGGSDSTASGVSGDGRIVVGTTIFNGFGGRAFRWVEGQGLFELGGLGGAAVRSRGPKESAATVGSLSVSPATLRLQIPGAPSAGPRRTG